jgi:sulfonate transport system substrate-binding protein
MRNVLGGHMKPRVQSGADFLPQVSQGVAVEWTVFPAGPPLLQGLAAGTIDICHTGEVLPVFAQADGVPLVYVGIEPPAPLGVAILVPAGSPLQSVSELKDKRVAVTNGSSAHYLLIRALAEDGFAPDDVDSAFLPPAAAGAAFARGEVDAWAIWDPFLAATEEATQARVLRDGSGLVSNRQFYVASRSFVDQDPDLAHDVLADFDAADRWAAAHRDEMAQLLSPRTGISVEALKVALGRLAYGVQPIDEDVIAEQQRIADTFYALGRIPRRIAVREAVWNPPKVGTAADSRQRRRLSLAVR